MVYHFVILSDEVDNFRREIDIDAEATFLDLHNIIVKTCKYKSDEMASFYTCAPDWSKMDEITLLDMNEDPTARTVSLWKSVTSTITSSPRSQSSCIVST